MSVVESVEEVSCFLGNDAAQENQGYQVRECHESVEDVGACPHGANREVRTDKDGRNIDPTVDECCLGVLASHQVL